MFGKFRTLTFFWKMQVLLWVGRTKSKKLAFQHLCNFERLLFLIFCKKNIFNVHTLKQVYFENGLNPVTKSHNNFSNDEIEFEKTIRSSRPVQSTLHASPIFLWNVHTAHTFPTIAPTQHKKKKDYFEFAIQFILLVLP